MANEAIGLVNATTGIGIPDAHAIYVPMARTINGLPLSSDITIETQGGIASNYLFCEDVMFPGTTPVWHELEKQSDGGTVGSHTATTTSYTELDRYVTAALDSTIIPEGLWQFELFCKMSGQSGQIQAIIYRVNSAGAIVGGALGTAESAVFTNTTTAPIRASVFITEKTGWATTDRIGVVLQGKKIGVPAATLTFYHDKTLGYVSSVNTPLTLLHNQLSGLNLGDYQHLTAARATDVANATNNATVSTFVKRDGSGGFSMVNLVASDITLSNADVRVISVAGSATDVTGKDLTIGAGSTSAGTSSDNVAGGSLIIQSGAGTGNAVSSILFKTGTTLTSGKTLQSLETKMTILGNGDIGMGRSPGYALHNYRASQYCGIMNEYSGTGDHAAFICNRIIGVGDLISIVWSSGATSTVFGINKASLAAIYTEQDGGNNYPTALAIGTLGAKPLVFGTNGTEKVRILSGGNVGIGVTAPHVDLEIAGGLQVNCTGTDANFPDIVGYLHSEGTVNIYSQASIGEMINIYKAQDSNPSWATGLGFTRTNNGADGNGTQSPLKSGDTIANLYFYGSMSSTTWGIGGALGVSPDADWGASARSSAMNFMLGTASNTLITVMSINGNRNITINGNLRIAQTTTNGAAQIELSDRKTGYSEGIAFNTYYDGANRYRNANDYAGYVAFNETGDIQLMTCPLNSGSAGAEISTFVYGLTVKNDGKVGIGTTASFCRLHVNGTGVNVGGTFYANILETKDQTNYNGIALGYDSTAENIGVIGSVGGGNIAFWTHNGTAWGERVRVTSDGKVGIGTTAPGHLLHVSAADGVADNNYMAGFYNYEDTAGRNYGVTIFGGSNSSDYSLAVANKASNPSFYVRGDGKVGIGTTSPAAPLHVVTASHEGARITDTAESLGLSLGYDDSGTTTAYLYNRYSNSTSSEIDIGFGSAFGSLVRLKITKDGKVFMPAIASNIDTNILYYNSSTGEITYGVPPI